MKISENLANKISKFLPKMFGLRQALAKIVKFCSDWPTGLKKNQFCSDCAVRPQKWPIFLRLPQTTVRPPTAST
jgi:hypothetical protein